MAKSVYRKLTRRKRTLLGYSQLWLAPDHILLVKSMRLVEQYQRFALADIQAITITKSPDRTPYQVVAALAATLWALTFLAVNAPFAKYFFVITGAIALAAVIVDLLRGPYCRCNLTTAVSRELLRPVSRLRTAQSFLAIVQPAIEAVQGSLGPPEEVRVSLPVAGVDQPPEVAASPGYLPEIVFGLFLIDAALILLAVRFPGIQIGSVLPTTFFAEIVLVAVALIRRDGRDPRRAIYVVMMLAVIGIGWDAVGVGRNLSTWISLIAESGRQTDPTALLGQLSWRHGALIAAIWRIVAGVTGLAAAFLGRASQ
jgi:hypothetical protein